MGSLPLVGHNFKHLAGTVDSKVVDSRAGIFAGIAINTHAANGTITVYDGTDATGTLIATITEPATITALAPKFLPFGCAFKSGLFVSVVGAAFDLTVLTR